MISRIAASAALLLALSTAAHAAGGSPTQRFLTSVEPESDRYLYVGAEGFRLPESEDEYFAVPIEGRSITNGDFEVGLGSSLLQRDTGTSTESGLGDSVVWLSQGTRTLPFANFASIQIAKFIETAKDGLEGNTEASVQLRALGGPTLFGYDASVRHEFASDNAIGGDRTVYSLGIRGQHRRLHFGIDWIRTDQESATDFDSIDLVFMHRYYDGSASYLLLEKGVSSGNDSWYVGIGYDIRIGL